MHEKKAIACDLRLRWRAQRLRPAPGARQHQCICTAFLTKYGGLKPAVMKRPKIRPR